MTTNLLPLLFKKRFLPLFITQFLGAFNDNAFKNALVILITYKLASGTGYTAQILVTLAAGFFIAPFFLFSATAGQLADKYPKAGLIRIVKLVEVILMLIATIGFILPSVSLLMLVLFMLGTQATFFGPLKYAILPEQLPERELIAGNGLIEAGTFLAILLGAIFGGLLILINNGIYIISGILVLFAAGGWCSSFFIPVMHLRNARLKVNINFIAETFRLIHYSRQRKDIFVTIIAISWFWAVGATFLSEFPVFAKNILSANQDVVTFFITLFTVGIAIGSLLCNKLLKGKVNTDYVPYAAWGITFFTLDLCFCASHFAALQATEVAGLQTFFCSAFGMRLSVDLLLLAVCGGIYTVPLYALLQQRSDETHRARVIASNNVLNALFMALATVGTLLLLQKGLDVNQVFLVVAILNIAVALYVRKLRK